MIKLYCWTLIPFLLLPLAACAFIASEPDPTPADVVPAEVPSVTHPSTPNSSTNVPLTSHADDLPELMFEALTDTPKGKTGALYKMGVSGELSYVPVLVELLRFSWWYVDEDIRPVIFESLDRIARQNPQNVESEYENAGWDWWFAWVGRHPEVKPPEGFAGWKGQTFATLVDPAMGAFLYDGVKSTIRLEEIVWGGVRKDGIPDLTSPPVIPAEEAAYLGVDERVFGVSINGEHRAYPHRILNAHEMANDVVGGVPIALAY